MVVERRRSGAEEGVFRVEEVWGCAEVAVEGEGEGRLLALLESPRGGLC